MLIKMGRTTERSVAKLSDTQFTERRVKTLVSVRPCFSDRDPRGDKIFYLYIIQDFIQQYSLFPVKNVEAMSMLQHLRTPSSKTT